MAVRLPQELIERSDAIRQLIELGLDRPAVKTRQPKKPRQRRSS
jgi:hypothetical protein